MDPDGDLPAYDSTLTKVYLGLTKKNKDELSMNSAELQKEKKKRHKYLKDTLKL